jgi:hypothetical protein
MLNYKIFFALFFSIGKSYLDISFWCVVIESDDVELFLGRNFWINAGVDVEPTYAILANQVIIRKKGQQEIAGNMFFVCNLFQNDK